MESTISATYLAKNLSDVLTRVRDRGERFVIQRDVETIATVAQANRLKGITWGEFLARYAELPRPDAEFADDPEAIQSEQGPAEVLEWPDQSGVGKTCRSEPQRGTSASVELTANAEVPPSSGRHPMAPS